MGLNVQSMAFRNVLRCFGLWLSPELCMGPCAPGSLLHGDSGLQGVNGGLLTTEVPTETSSDCMFPLAVSDGCEGGLIILSRSKVIQKGNKERRRK